MHSQPKRSASCQGGHVSVESGTCETATVSTSVRRCRETMLTLLELRQVHRKQGMLLCNEKVIHEIPSPTRPAGTLCLQYVKDHCQGIGGDLPSEVTSNLLQRCDRAAAKSAYPGMFLVSRASTAVLFYLTGLVRGFCRSVQLIAYQLPRILVETRSSIIVRCQAEILPIH